LGAKTRFAPVPSTINQDAGSPPVQEKVEVELITVRRFGFEPAEITRPAGEFILHIDDRSQQQQDLALALSRTQAERPREKLKDVDLKRGQVNWLDRFNLPPGDYLLTEANHPEWQCRITLTPR
jgi:hypothetical protein